MKGREAFLFGGLSPPNKNFLLRILCVSVVRNYFGASKQTPFFML